MDNICRQTSQITNNSKPIYIYDEELGWINVTLFLDNLKKAMIKLTNKRNNKKDFNLIRLNYLSARYVKKEQ